MSSSFVGSISGISSTKVKRMRTISVDRELRTISEVVSGNDQRRIDEVYARSMITEELQAKDTEAAIELSRCHQDIRFLKV